MIGARDPRQRDPEYLGWVSRLPCAACMVKGKFKSGVHVAHLRTGSPEHEKRPTGMAEKPSDVWVLPLCPPHHVGDTRQTKLTQHAMGGLDFWRAVGINPFDLCLALRAAYENGTSGSTVVARFAAQAKPNTGAST